MPLTNWKLCLKNSFRFRKNKRIIKIFIEENKERITTAEYPFTFVSRMMKGLGLNYDTKCERSIMWYSSMIPNKLNNKIKENLKQIKNKENYSISLGAIAIGILGNEPILPHKNLKKDLEFVNGLGFKKIVIFRLGGLNKEYLKVINKFIE